MALSLLDKLTNFLMPEDDQFLEQQSAVPSHKSSSYLKIHTNDTTRFIVVSPKNFNDVELYADYLKKNVAVIVNIEKINVEMQRRIFDYLNGVSYILGLSVDKITDNILIYVPKNIEICKELYAFSIPTYVKM